LKDVETLTLEQAVKLAGEPHTVFVDVRETAERERTGTGANPGLASALQLSFTGKR
jgi:rhodanese-related sulfurtransferase